MAVNNLKPFVVLLVLCFSTIVMGQNNNPQKECFEQAKQQAAGLTFSNHYDQKTQTCWYQTKQFWQTGEVSPVPHQSRAFLFVGNVYEEKPTAMFFGPEVGEISPTDACAVDGVKCTNLDQFVKLVKKHYPGL